MNIRIGGLLLLSVVTCWCPMAVALDGQTESIAGDAAETMPTALAEQPDSNTNQATFRVFWENDSRYMKPNNPHDRHYTNGLAFAFTIHPQWADSLAAGLPDSNSFGAANTSVGFVFGQLMFTPEDIANQNLLTYDRPYAGYLYGGMFLQRYNDAVMDHLQVELGVIGPSSLAKDAQIWVHTFTGGIRPNGWTYQIKDEPAFQVYYRRKWRVDLGKFELFNQQFHIQAIPQAGIALGTVHRNIEGGGTIRIGFNLENDFGPSRLMDISAQVKGERQDGQHLRNGWSVQAYATGSAKIVEHNEFLEGASFRSNPHHVDPQVFFGEGILGIVLAYRKGPGSLELGYSQTYLTEEFKHQLGASSYGAWTFAARFEF